MRREMDEDLDDRGFGESSRYAAHLDRGWSMLEQGEFHTARAAALHASELRPESPDAAVLLGAVALSEGHADEGVEWYERAIELDPEYPEPYASLAQAYLYDLDRPHDARRVCDIALGLDGLTPIERLDLGVLGAESAVSVGDEDDARERLRRLPDLDALARVLGAEVEADGGELSPAAIDALAHLSTEGPEDDSPPDEDELGETAAKCVSLGLRIARTHLDLGDAERASDWLHWVVARSPGESDAWYLLSEAELHAGNPRESAFAALQTFRLDGELPLPPWSPSAALVHRAVVDIVTRCPSPTIRAQVDAPAGLLILVHEVPALELVLEGIDPRLPGLALATRAREDGRPMLTGLAVYRRNLLRLAGDAESFEAELEHTIHEELAGHFQLGDDERALLGLEALPVGIAPPAEATPPGPEAAESAPKAPPRAAGHRARGGPKK